MSVADTEVGEWSESLDVGFIADSSVTLPGMGERGTGCGQWYPSQFCGTCGEPHFAPSRCQNRKCPDCWTTWTAQRAEGITTRLHAAREAEPDGLRRRQVHGIISPPEGDVRTLNHIKQGYRRAYEVADEHGIRGGVCIFHGFRATEETKELFTELKSIEGAFDGGIWKFIREHARDWRSLTKWSPHWHVLGLAEDVQTVTRDEWEAAEQNEWVFHHVDHRFESHRITNDAGYEDTASTATYLLSHATFQPDSRSHVIRWFGSLSNNSFSPEEELELWQLRAIEQRAAEACSTAPDEEGEGGEAGSQECEQDDCQGHLDPIWDAGYALMDMGFCERIGRDAEHRLACAFEWAVGEVTPPPGMKKPRTEEECREAFATLL